MRRARRSSPSDALPSGARRRRAALVVFACSCAFIVQSPGWAQTSYMSLAKALSSGTPQIDRWHWQTHDVAYTNGHYYSVKPPGLVLATLPLYRALDAAGAQRLAYDARVRAESDGLWRTATYDWRVLQVMLLGGLRAQARGRVLPPPAHPQGPALLAWLALHPGEHPRGPLAALLWPQMPHANARASLRSAAWSLRRMLGPDERDVIDGRETLGLDCTTDLQEFERRIAAGDLEQALRLCGGVLLDGLEEHEWVLAARAEHERRVEMVRGQAARRQISAHRE